MNGAVWSWGGGKGCGNSCGGASQYGNGSGEGDVAKQHEFNQMVAQIQICNCSWGKAPIGRIYAKVCAGWRSDATYCTLGGRGGSDQGCGNGYSCAWGNCNGRDIGDVAGPRHIDI